ncbi:MAG: mechanosensitive ion channel family protein [Gammaproteobacteria bacterium]|nr:mechanosensitive ion channel family protein [Gammaproteobacteria bacterium]
MNILDWLEYELFGNPLREWTISAVVLIGTLALLFIVRRLLRGRLQKLAVESDRVFFKVARHVIGQSKGWFLLLIAMNASLRSIDASESFDLVFGRLLVVGMLIQMGLWAVAGFGRFMLLRREQQLEEDASAVAAMDVVSFLIRVSVWVIVFLLALDNVGVNITALVAGLGVGGIAVALAAQNIISDLFASLSIVLDKPFVLGDFLVIDDLYGNVEKVGLKTTRVRSLSGEQLVFSNNDLLSSRIRNYGQMVERRIVFTIGVIYQTPHEKLERIPGIIEDIIVRQSSARFDRAHFQRYGDFSLNFEIVYYVESSDYKLYMDIQQAVNLEIFRRFAETGIEFAYPTQTLFVNSDRKGALVWHGE